MEKFQEARLKAIKYITVADHILTQTYPHIKDPKLLLAVLNNIHLSMNEAMGSLFYYMKYSKKIPPFHNSYIAKLELMKSLVDENEITKELVNSLREVNELTTSHKDSAIEFARKDSFIISSDNYDLKRITSDELKRYIKQTKLLITLVEKKIGEND